MDFKTSTIKKVGYILKFYRRIKGISQPDMADFLNVSPRNYQRLESGEIEPKLETLSKISNVLNISIPSLINSDNIKILKLAEISTTNEFKTFNEIDALSEKDDHSFYFAKLLIEKDKQIIPTKIAPRGRIDGTKAEVSDSLLPILGLQNTQFEIDQYLLHGNCVERWEIVFRLNLKNPIIENSFLFPTGLKVFQEYHYDLNANPDSPSSECLIRDITDRYNLEKWIKEKY